MGLGYLPTNVLVLWTQQWGGNVRVLLLLLFQCYHATLYVWICMGAICAKNCEVDCSNVLSWKMVKEVSATSDRVIPLNISPIFTCKSHKLDSKQLHIIITHNLAICELTLRMCLKSTVKPSSVKNQCRVSNCWLWGKQCPKIDQMYITWERGLESAVSR